MLHMASVFLGNFFANAQREQEAFDDAIDPSKDLTAGNIFVPSGNQCEILADDYAHEKVDRYDENLSE